MSKVAVPLDRRDAQLPGLANQHAEAADVETDDELARGGVLNPPIWTQHRITRGPHISIRERTWSGAWSAVAHGVCTVVIEPRGMCRQRWSQNNVEVAG